MAAADGAAPAPGLPNVDLLARFLAATTRPDVCSVAGALSVRA